jgi:hypothetical protein
MARVGRDANDSDGRRVSVLTLVTSLKLSEDRLVGHGPAMLLVSKTLWRGMRDAKN